MGYEITAEIGVTIRKDKIEAIRERIKNMEHSKDCEGCYVEEFLEQMTIDDVGNIELEDYYGNWDDCDGFVKFLTPYADKGRLDFVGEDHEKWAFHYDGKGKCFVIEFIEKVKKTALHDADKMLMEKI